MKKSELKQLIKEVLTESNYYTGPINKIIASAKASDHKATMKIVHDNASTNWLSVSVETLEEILKILNKNEDN